MTRMRLVDHEETQFRPHARPAPSHFITIDEECNCNCADYDVGEGCGCGRVANESINNYKECVVRTPKIEFSELDIIDDIEHILAVSNVNEKKLANNGGGGGGKNQSKKKPLLRAKTLPTIVSLIASSTHAPRPPDAAAPADQNKDKILASRNDKSASISPNRTQNQSKDPKSQRRSSSPFRTHENNSGVDQHTQEKDIVSIVTATVKCEHASPTAQLVMSSQKIKGEQTTNTTSTTRTSTSSSGSNSALSKFAKLWLQKDKNANNKRSVPVICVALDGQGMRKASSIDSLVDDSSDLLSHSPSSDFSNTTSPERSMTSMSSLDSTRMMMLGTTTTTSITGVGDTLCPPTPNFLMAANSPNINNWKPGSSGGGSGATGAGMGPAGHLPTSPSMPAKLYRGWKRSSMDLLGDANQLSKSEKKKLEKINKSNTDLQALFSAVEDKKVDKVGLILDTTDVEVNAVNSDGFSPLDVATMTNSLHIAKLLQSKGARSANSFGNKESRLAQLVGLLDESEKKIEELSKISSTAIASNNNNVASNKENDKYLAFWEKRHALLQQMWVGTQQMSLPNEPYSISVIVLNSTTLRVKIEEPQSQDNGAIVTKYKIEWTTQGNFSILTGDVELMDIRILQYDITGLTQGDRIYIRAAAANNVGYSNFILSSPTSAVPSVWRDVDGRKPRSSGRLSTLDELFSQVRNTRTAHASEIKEISPDPQPIVQQRKTQVKKSIKSLFAGAPKFQKTLSRGVYLACLLYTEDKILVSTEENIPTVEVDETYPSSLHTDMLWMMKVACTWEDVKNLRQDMEKSHSSPTVHFRSKLLNAASQIQSALGIQDLGQFYYRPLKDNNGTIVLCTVRYIRDPKILNALSVKWVPLTKVQRKLSMFSTSSDANLNNQIINLCDILTSSIQDQLLYHQVSRIPLAKGLYLGYLKLKSSMDQIRLLVPHKTPNVLPHCRIRDNPHVSCEEWEWLQTLQNLEKKSSLPSEAQIQFEHNIFTAAKRLFNHLCIEHDNALSHRVYTVEVIELSVDVSFILVLPSVEQVCSVPGNDDDFSSKPEFIMLPVQIFELAHMNTYNTNFITRYARISSILEMDLLIAQHAQREAFSSDELSETKSRLTKLQDFQNKVDMIWKGMRWIMDVLTYARDKQVNGGLCFNILYKRHQLLHPTRAALIGHIRVPDTPPKLKFGRSTSSLCEPSTTDKSRVVLPSIKISSCPRNVSESSLCSVTDPLMLGQHHAQIKKSNSVGSNFCVPDGALELSRKSSISSCDSRTSGDSQRTDEDDDAGLMMKSSSSESSKDPLSDQRLSVSSLGGSIKSLSSNGSGIRLSADLPSRSQSNASLNSQCSLDPSSHRRGCFRDKTRNLKSRSTESADPEAYVFKRPHSAMSDQSSVSSSSSRDVPLPDIVRVYAAYNSGLSCGTSVKLHITSRTTAREVVNLVVKQLNMAVVMKGKAGPIYSSQQLANFCLVSVVGARERCLRDDFRPLQLQNPWTSGKLYVRMKNDVLAAIQQDSSYSGRSSAFL